MSATRWTRPNLDAIPEEMRVRPQWAMWRIEDGQKVPYNCRTGGKAMSNKPATWSKFTEAVKKLPEFDGLNFATGDGIAAFDIDGCCDPNSGFIEPWALELAREAATYCEWSPSRTGLRLWGFAELGENDRKKIPLVGYSHPNGREPAFEQFSGLHFASVTGDRLPDAPDRLADCSSFVNLLRQRFPAPEPPPPNQPPPSGATMDDDLLIAKALAAANGEKFRLLWEGNWAAAGYGSQSEADSALCCMLGFWTGRNAAQVDRVFRRSGLMRPKWDEAHHAGGGTYGAVTVARAMERVTDTYQPRRPRTDVGNAERFHDQHGADVRYTVDTKTWFEFQDPRWVGDATAAIMQRAKATVRRINIEVAEAEDDKEREALRNHAKKSESEARLNAMVSLVRWEPGIPMGLTDFDCDPFLACALNGVLDLQRGEFRPARREDLLTKQIPVAYNPAAWCPRWIKFLTEIMGGNQNLIQFLQRAVGYSLTGDVREQVLFFLFGSGANGKSTFLRILLRLLGDYGTQAAKGLLIEHRGDRHTTEIAELIGKRGVVSTEVGEGKNLAEELVKQLTGADRMKGRFMRCDNIEFDPTFKLWLAANHKPIIKGQDHAIWRRIPLIPFTVTFKDPDEAGPGEPVKDPTLYDALVGELPGILNWAIKGCVAWQKEGLNIPPEVRAATAEYKAEMDVLGAFIDDRCVVKPAASAGSTELYDAYVGWCIGTGESVRSQKVFSQSLVERGYHKEKKNVGIRFQGIGVKDR
jgi:putative DNA primase/helicase